MRIAILGTRGVPARYGGFETFAEELSKRLAAKGHQVTVYCRTYLYSGEADLSSPGVSRVLLGCLRTKHLETLSHMFLSAMHLWGEALRGRPLPEAIILCNAANAPLIPLVRLLGIPVALNVDGIERQRGKWGKAGAAWYRFGEWCAVRFATTVISDAQVIREYYLTEHGVSSEVIPYGFNEDEQDEVERKLSTTVGEQTVSRISKWNLAPDKYLLYVSRLEPENNAHVVIQAYNELQQSHPEAVSAYPLVIVGDAPYASEYILELHRLAGPQVLFLGFQFGETYRALQLGAAAYIQATEVGGTHPALVEAMGFGNAIVANQTPENTEVLGDAGWLYPRNDSAALAELIRSVLSSPERKAMMQRARHRALECYSWKGVVEQYEDLCERLGNGSGGSSKPAQ